MKDEHKSIVAKYTVVLQQQGLDASKSLLFLLACRRFE